MNWCSMQVVHGYSHVPITARSGVIAIGNFDGVHRGHRALIAETVAKAKELGIPTDIGGIWLGEPNAVSANGPAGLAGLRSGDVVTKIGNYQIRNESDLAVAMILQQPGDKIPVEYYRAGEVAKTTIPRHAALLVSAAFKTKRYDTRAIAGWTTGWSDVAGQSS